MDAQKTIAVTIELRPEEAARLRAHAEDANGGTLSWFVRAACAHVGLFGPDFDPDLRFGDEEDSV